MQINQAAGSLLSPSLPDPVSTTPLLLSLCQPSLAPGSFIHIKRLVHLIRSHLESSPSSDRLEQLLAALNLVRFRAGSLNGNDGSRGREWSSSLYVLLVNTFESRAPLATEKEFENVAREMLKRKACSSSALLSVSHSLASYVPFTHVILI
jgi:hypothetical protein